MRQNVVHFLGSLLIIFSFGCGGLSVGHTTHEKEIYYEEKSVCPAGSTEYVDFTRFINTEDGLSVAAFVFCVDKTGYEFSPSLPDYLNILSGYYSIIHQKNSKTIVRKYNGKKMVSKKIYNFAGKIEFEEYVGFNDKAGLPWHTVEFFKPKYRTKTVNDLWWVRKIVLNKQQKLVSITNRIPIPKSVDEGFTTKIEFLDGGTLCITKCMQKIGGNMEILERYLIKGATRIDVELCK